MNNRNSTFLCFILLVYFVKQDAFADREDKSEEMEDSEYRMQAEGNFSAEASGPPDSHEAMNNREINSKLSKNNREKRSYEFLMGLVNNNSKFEITNVDSPPPQGRKYKGEMAANEALLELMVKIASDPDQWEKVHSLLQKIDNDLITSKKILERIHNTIDETPSTVQTVTSTFNINDEQIFFEKKEQNFEESHKSSHLRPSTQEDRSGEEIQPVRQVNINDTNPRVQKMSIILKDVNSEEVLRNHTEAALKTNKWPEFGPEGRIIYKPEQDSNVQNNKSPKYPWQNENKSGSKTYPRNFAYHRVTGHPLYHASYDKNPKAYIAVSVIAPKPLNSRPQDEDLILENELRQLKPWTHKQNLKNMAAIRSRWVIQSDNANNNKEAP